MDDATVGEIMRGYATDALALAQKHHGIRLDFSERSLDDVDRMLAPQIKDGLIVPEKLTPREQETLSAFCMILGGYVGEVIIRNIGGEWRLEIAANGAQGAKIVTKGDVEGSPPTAIRRALTEPFKSIVTYYRTLQVALGLEQPEKRGGVIVLLPPELSRHSPDQVAPDGSRALQITSSTGFKTALTATLAVRDWPRAMEFYKAAFGARELHVVPGGGVAQLAVDGAEFWVAEESREHSNFSPESLGGCSVRMLLIVEDPETVCQNAVEAGAKQVVPVGDSHGWRIGRIVDPAGHHWEIARPLL